MQKEIKLNQEIMKKLNSGAIKAIDIVKYLIDSEGIEHDENMDLKDIAINTLIADGRKIESATIDNWEEKIILTLGDEIVSNSAEKEDFVGVEFEKGYELGWNLDKEENLKEKVLNLFGFKESEIKHECVRKNGDWLYYSFLADKKEVKTSNGYNLIFDFVNNLVFVNDRKFKVEFNHEFAFKALKTKIKIKNWCDFMDLLADNTFAIYSYKNIAEMLYNI
ncbi:hypothetical protein DVV91_17000 [Clostridium botulinum]|uniref:hypothetical protein n=1 Tax=Clostridium botulinum TaxID=1491 RepID=UPI0019685EAC|nr:hypothetical protein [Clostridium botulinum]MBN1076021.1 hypothetical protein [Clostridium botulinum]